MRILDPTCSARSIWFDKNNPCVVHCDIRVEDLIVGKGKSERKWRIRPDVQMDFTSMPFPDSHFDMVVFDPPHLLDLSPTAWMAQKYGMLFPDWKAVIGLGFQESWRVLKEEGTLVFKWSVGDNKNRYVPLKDILSLAPSIPLFGHTTGSKSTTKWVIFIKFKEIFE